MGVTGARDQVGSAAEALVRRTKACRQRCRCASDSECRPETRQRDRPVRRWRHCRFGVRAALLDAESTTAGVEGVRALAVELRAGIERAGAGRSLRERRATSPGEVVSRIDVAAVGVDRAALGVGGRAVLERWRQGERTTAGRDGGTGVRDSSGERRRVRRIRLPLFELALAVALLLGVATRSRAIVAGALMTAFVIGVASAWARGLSIDCGCFGGGGEVADGEAHYLPVLLRDLGFTLTRRMAGCVPGKSVRL